MSCVMHILSTQSKRSSSVNTNAFERKEINERELISLPLPCPEVQNFCSSVKAATGATVFLVGGAVRQLVRTITWKGVVPEDINLFLQLNLRDRDVLVDRVVKEEIIQSLWAAKHLPKADTEMDIMVYSVSEYLSILDWHSNAVFYDGVNLLFLPLKPGEDYIANDKDRDYILLRGWINHHPIRGFDCFTGTFPAGSLGSFYFPTYLKKLAELNKMYGNDQLFFSEIETLYKSKRIGKQTYLAYKLGRETIAFVLLNNIDAILITMFYLLLFLFLLFFL